MSTRSYLSIGDVLSLLREEFPDVTISKIRFLESQGLVDPERSPSGYRKFYDHDVDRLRWVLRQQRDQFLPLKVIRDRLAAAGNGVPADDVDEADEAAGADEAVGTDEAVGGRDPAEGAWTNGAAAELPTRAPTVHAAVGAPAADRSQAAEAWRRSEPPPSNVVRFDSERRQPAAGHPAAGPGQGQQGHAPAGPPAPASAAGARSAAAGRDRSGENPDGARDRAPAAEATARPSDAGNGAPRQGAAGRGSAGPDQATGDQGLFAEPQAPGRPRSSGATAGRGADPAQGAGSQGRGRAAERSAGAAQSRPGAGGSSASMLSGSVSGVSLTPAELAAATGLSPQELSALEGFGLIAPMAIAGDTFYDEEALTVAKLVVEFSKFGIEPRHLRLYRNAVDREAGLVEQVITPLLRQRNPEARQRAMDAADELTRLGQGLRAALVRTELRRQFGG